MRGHVLWCTNGWHHASLARGAFSNSVESQGQAGWAKVSRAMLR
jgi:hypothetical protein